MRTTFHPSLPNGPAGDPVLWVDVPDEGQALLIDLGDLAAIPPRKLARVEHAIVTHAHMDHFIGFDRLLRATLGRERELVVTGPAGFLEHVRGRIAGYTWNIVGSYPVRLLAEEIDGAVVRAERYTGPGGMRPEPAGERPFDGVVAANRAWTLRVATLDHGIPVLGVLLAEVEHLGVDKDALTRLGLRPGPWLAGLKNAVRRAAPDDLELDAELLDGGARRTRLGDLAPRLLVRSRGQRLAYLTDLVWSEANLDRARALASEPDLLVCDAAFLDADRALARERGHLTARQCGELARAVGARRLAPFHFSPRYTGRERELFAEAAAAFGGPVVQYRLPDAPIGARRRTRG